MLVVVFLCLVEAGSEFSDSSSVLAASISASGVL